MRYAKALVCASVGWVLATQGAATYGETPRAVDPEAVRMCSRGMALLGSDSLKAAEDAFRRSLRIQKDYPPSLNGLGLVFLQTPKALIWAVK